MAIFGLIKILRSADDRRRRLARFANEFSIFARTYGRAMPQDKRYVKIPNALYAMQWA